MSVVFCTTCKGRVQHIERTLPQNLADNPEAKFILLDYNSQDHLQQYLKDNHSKDIAEGRLIVYSFPEATRFNMAHAKNMAHRCGILEGGEILVNLDADNFCGRGFDQYVRENCLEDTYLSAKWDWKSFPRGCSGRIVVTAQAFLKAGGYDEKYADWGPDDKDFEARLTKLGYINIAIAREFLDAIKHTDKMRFREYPHARHCSAGSGAFRLGDICNPIANWGRFGCGTVYRNFELEAIDLGPVPTRLFGIGLHKSATTSLHRALEQLGYDSWHWPSGESARRIHDELSAEGKSIELERHYALSDLPIPVLFRECDRAYPRSKFILTIRDEVSWLRSVQRHFSSANPFKWEWKAYPFMNKIHQKIYGRKSFDAETFLVRYKRHNAEVQEYFKDRPGDLLVMNMDEGAGWQELCSFLGKPVPNIPYPREFVTQ